MQGESARSADDPFALLGLALGFGVDSSQLDRAWLARTARLHPDRPGAPPDSAGQLARLNDARDTLADPERRAAALLALLGGPSKEQDKSLPDGFLMEMLEVRQQMEEEIGSSAAGREKWEKWAAERRAGHIERVRGLFTPPVSPDALKRIRMELNAWRYIERMIEQLDPGYRSGPE